MRLCPTCTLRDQERLEIDFIDKFGIGEVLFQMSMICAGKADHIRASYDDRRLARAWESVGNALEKMGARVRDL